MTENMTGWITLACSSLPVWLCLCGKANGQFSRPELWCWSRVTAGGSWGEINSCSWSLPSWYRTLSSSPHLRLIGEIFSEIWPPCTTCWGCRRMFSFISLCSTSSSFRLTWASSSSSSSILASISLEEEGSRAMEEIWVIEETNHSISPTFAHCSAYD